MASIANRKRDIVIQIEKKKKEIEQLYITLKKLDAEEQKIKQQTTTHAQFHSCNSRNKPALKYDHNTNVQNENLAAPTTKYQNPVLDPLDISIEQYSGLRIM